MCQFVYVPHYLNDTAIEQLDSLLHQTLAVFLFPGHLDHCLWRSVQEDEFLKERLLQLHLSRLADHKDVRAELQDPVHTRQVLKHDGPGDPVEELPDELSNDQHHRHVQAHDAVRSRGSGRVGISFTAILLARCLVTYP